MDGEALLGPLPAPWRAQVSIGTLGTHRFYYRQPSTGEESSDDPRLSAIPIDARWKPIHANRTREDPVVFQKYENVDTGEQINFDPRLSAASLIQHGVPIENIRLV